MHILGYHSRGDFEPQPRQLRLDPPLTPNSVLHGHPPDQGAQFGCNWGAARLASPASTPTPIAPPPLPVPPQHRFGFYDEQRRSPAEEPAIRQNPETPVRIREARPRLAALQDQQLLAEAKIVYNSLGRIAAAKAHSKQRNVDLSRMLSDKQGG